ncbi:ABC transporter substrate-binding protein [Mumia sp. DW29H23]|uniref:ABC transporter substrate-binding protein n=1 Tax=Mumia sp. DW29H23 TaxID=3421241 RepID=UPI003D689D2B
MRPSRTLLTMIGVTALALSGCGGGSSDAGSGDSGTLADGKTFTMSVATDPGNLDPMMTVLSVTRQVDRFLYGTLVQQEDDGTIVGSLAEKWDADTTKATFTLRDGITCSDGAAVTASDVAENINFIADPANKSPLNGLWVTAGTKATADDATRTVTVTSGAPDAFLLVNLGTVPIVCGKGLEDRSVLAKGESGTGMFTISEVVPNDHYTLKRRDDYTWGPGDFDPEQKGLPDEVVFKVVPNETTAANLLTSGDINAVSIAGPDQDRLLAQDLFHGDLVSPIGQFYFNQADGRATQDEEVRRALTQALDLDELTKVVTGGKGKRSEGMVTIAPKPCSIDTVSGHLPDHDDAAAKSALDAAGWTAGADGVRTKDGKKLSFTVIYGTQLGSTMTAAAELVQQTWKELGADVTLKGVDSPGLNEVLFGTGDWDVSMGPLTVGLPSQIVPFLSGPVPPQGVNFAHIENAGYTESVTKASAMAGAEGCESWAAGESALFDSVDVVPYADTVVPTFGKGAEFAVNDGIDPASIRMYE